MERAQDDVALVDAVVLDAVADRRRGQVAADAEAEPVHVGGGHELVAAQRAALAGAEAGVEPAHAVERGAADGPVGAVDLGPAGEVLIGVAEGEHAEE